MSGTRAAYSRGDCFHRDDTPMGCQLMAAALRRKSPQADGSRFRYRFPREFVTDFARIKRHVAIIRLGEEALTAGLQRRA